MRNVVLYIAMSLDGYISDPQGGVDWLNGHGEEEPAIDSYAVFHETVDTVLLGWNTYHQIVTELSPEKWVYHDLKSYVFTHREMTSNENILFTKKDPCSLVRTLKQEPGKDIWVCGGAEIVRQLLDADLIDVFDLSVIPTILGDGIHLFDTRPESLNLRLVRTQVCNGTVELIYHRR